jgi:hypothetical protein
MVLTDGKPFPVVRRLSPEVRARCLLKLIEEPCFVLLARPMLRQSVPSDI